MSEQHTRIRGESAPGRRGTRRRSRRDTTVDSEAMREKLDQEFRARIQKRLKEGAGQDEDERAAAGPTVAGRVRTQDLQKQLDEIKQEARPRVTADEGSGKAAAEETRAKLSSGEMLDDLPVAEEVEPESAASAEPAPKSPALPAAEGEIPETEIDGPRPLPTHAGGTIVLPKSTSSRGRRSQILRVDGTSAGSQRTEAPADAPRPTRLVFKFAGVLLLIFMVLMAYRWVALGRAPSDLVTAEGQAELANEVRAWTNPDLKKQLGGDAPETEADTVRLVEESQAHAAKTDAKSEAKSEDAAEVVASPWDSPKGSAPRPAKPKGPGESYTLAPQKRTGGRSAEPLTRTFSEKHPGLAAARDAFAQANTYYAQSDPRSASFETVQKNIRLAIPCLERCLDECDKARKQGIKAAELDVLEQSAAMRLYDCRKRSTVQP